MDAKIEARFAATARSKTFRNLRAYAGLQHKSVLDLGCSFGEFLTHFGPGSVGVTIEPQETAYGKTRGLDIRVGNIEDREFSLGRRFDAIYANNLFEHLYSPHAFLIRAKELLAPEGVLVLGVPCVPKLVWLLHLKKFRGSLAGGHINFFTKATLRHTVERAGWDVECIRGFRFTNPFLDHCLDLIYPHFYVVARPDPDFAYTDKRLAELAGYGRA
jgi:SAM-dependent methyltransferase